MQFVKEFPKDIYGWLGALALLLLILSGAALVFSIIACLTLSYDVGPYMETDSYYKQHVKKNGVSIRYVAGTDSAKIKIYTYSVKMERRWGPDRKLFVSENEKTATKFFFDLQKGKAELAIQREALITHFNNLPFEEKVQFLTKINMGVQPPKNVQ